MNELPESENGKIANFKVGDLLVTRQYVPSWGFQYHLLVRIDVHDKKNMNARPYVILELQTKQIHRWNLAEIYYHMVHIKDLDVPRYLGYQPKKKPV